MQAMKEHNDMNVQILLTKIRIGVCDPPMSIPRRNVDGTLA